MAKRILLALLAMLAASYAAPAAATTCGGFTVPTDVAAQAGWTCSTKTPTYDTTNTAHNLPIDPAVTPPPQVGLTNIPIPSDAGRITSSAGDSTNGLFCTLRLNGGPAGCTEAKFRTAADQCHYAPDDPIRNFGAPGTSHLHDFFGNCTTNAYSTYKSLRKRGLLSAAVGTDVNATGYWFPAVIVKNRDGDGIAYVVKMDYSIPYYVAPADTTAELAAVQRSVPIPPGERYVFGYVMDGDWLSAILASANTANAAAGGSGSRYRLSNVTNEDFDGQARYNCMNATADISVRVGGTDSSKYLKKADGSDPWGGTCTSATYTATVSGTTMSVTSAVTGTIAVGQEVFITGQPTMGHVLSGSGTTWTLDQSYSIGTSTNVHSFQQFWVSLVGPTCWDGERLWSAGGYKHIIPKVWDSKYGEYVCPNNYYAIPGLTIEFQFTHYGWADYGRWELASDAGRRTVTGRTTAQDPDGYSFHTDWLGAWDNNKMLIWEQACLGVFVVTTHTPHQCAVSQIDASNRLVGTAGSGSAEGGAGGRNPQVDLSSLPRALTSDAGWGKIPSAWTNSITTMHVHH